MTNPQLDASDPKLSVWVHASAGTGKTKILTDRVLRLLLSGNDPAKILCLTFTKAAANEMSIRINKELSAWVTLDETKLIERLSNLSGQVPDKKTINYARKLFVQVLDTEEGLKIQTIHSFCQYLIKKFPFEADISPSFKVIDDQTSYLLIKEAKLNLFKKISQNLDDSDLALLKQSVNYLAWNIHEAGMDELIEEIVSNSSNILNIIEYHIDHENLSNNLLKNLDIEKYINDEELLDKFCSWEFDVVKEMAQIMINSSSDSERIRGEHMLEWIRLDKEEKINKISDYLNIFLTKENQPTKNLVTKKILERNPHILDNLKDEQNRILKLIEDRKSAKLYLHSMHLIRFSKELLFEYQRLKKKQLYLDYNDLISTTHKLLTNSNINEWILYKLDGGIDHILVDEAQDTSKEQWQIIENLSREFFVGAGSKDIVRTVFIVGDEKQSIFSFQGADPSTFKLMHEYFINRTKHIENSFKSIKLDMSYRSTRPVLEIVDKIFESKELLNSIQSSEEALKHKAYRKFDAGNVYVWPLIDIKDDNKKDEAWPLPINIRTKLNPQQKLAELISIKIQDWLESKKILQSKNRPIKAGDILILVRRRNEFVEFLIKELKKKSIPVAGADKLVITDHIAIMDLIALCKFLLLPYDDLNLACVLKSPLIGINEDELFKLSYNRPGSLWENLINKARLTEKYKVAYQYLQELITKADFLTPFQLFSEILDIEDGRKKFHSRLGAEVIDPLDEFLNLALKYEQNHSPSLQGFIKWLESINVSIKRDLEQGRDEIRIMTVHSAKGLQAPIVFLPDTTFSVNNQNYLLFCSKTNLVYWPANVKNYNKTCQDLKDKIAIENQNESNRLLYVALTRAEDEIIICGYKSKNLPNDNCWYNLIKNTIKNLGNECEFSINANFYNHLASSKKFVLSYKQEINIEATNPDQNLFENIKSVPEFINKKVTNQKKWIILNPSNIYHHNEMNLSPVVDKNSRIKGIIIHKILELLPKAFNSNYKSFIGNYLNKYAYNLSGNEKATIIDDCLNLLLDPKLLEIFKKPSRSEVKIQGLIDQYMISGQIDRLVFSEDNIDIIDYKTTINIPTDIYQVNKTYINQMFLYKLLVSQIYPTQKITCTIIWTHAPKFMIIPNDLFDNIELSDLSHIA